MCKRLRLNVRGSSSLPPAPALSKQSKLHTRTTEGRPNQAARHKKSNQQSVDTPTTITFPPHTQKHQRWAVPLSMGTVFFFFFFFWVPPTNSTNQPTHPNKQTNKSFADTPCHPLLLFGDKGEGCSFPIPHRAHKTHSLTHTHAHPLTGSVL